jgi:macrolide transport system ATP-binding/permease protein
MKTTHLPKTRYIIRAQNIRKDFRLGNQWVHALKNVAFAVPEGQFTTIMGPSGSGKSTLLYVLGGLDKADEGIIEVAGKRIDTMRGDDLAEFRRNTIGFIFQAFHLVPSMTALENVALPGVFAGMSKPDREERAYALLEKLGMGERTDHRPHQLSGGQQQRVAIARALFNDPPIIMGDEPTGALDSKTGEIVMNMLRQLCDKQGKTIIVVTHDQHVADYSDRMIHLKDGEIIQDTVLKNKTIKRIV